METTLAQLSDGVNTMLALDEIGMDVALSQIGVDSLNMVEMIIICQQVYINAGNYDDTKIDGNTTLREIDQEMSDLSAI
jgi:hypothetical protein